MNDAANLLQSPPLLMLSFNGLHEHVGIYLHASHCMRRSSQDLQDCCGVIEAASYLQGSPLFPPISSGLHEHVRIAILTPSNRCRLPSVCIIPQAELSPA